MFYSQVLVPTFRIKDPEEHSLQTATCLQTLLAHDAL
jgi:hypothetical protein